MSSIYHLPADVSAQLKNIGFTNVINATYIQVYCDQTEAQVIGYISKKYVMPIDQTKSPQSFILLTYLCTLLTAGRADAILRRDGVAQVNPNEKNKINNLLNMGNKMLDDIMNDRMVLSDAQRLLDLPSYVGFDKPDINAVSSPYTLSGGQPTNGPTIKKGFVQW
jgi:hypothetical protein